MNKTLEIKITCQVIDHYPPHGIAPVRVEDQEVPFCITKNNLQVYYKDGVVMIDRAAAIKLLELLTEQP